MIPGDASGPRISLLEVALFAALAFSLLFAGTANADEIVSTATSGGEVAYLVNCTAPCTVNLTNDRTSTLIANASHTGYTWGLFTSTGAGRFNLSLWNASGIIDSLEVNTGTFNPTFTTEVNDRLGKEIVGGAVLLGVGLGAALLGLEGGFLIIGLAVMIEAEQGYAPSWTVTLLVIFAAVTTGVGLYVIFGGLK